MPDGKHTQIFVSQIVLYRRMENTAKKQTMLSHWLLPLVKSFQCSLILRLQSFQVHNDIIFSVNMKSKT